MEKKTYGREAATILGFISFLLMAIWGVDFDAELQGQVVELLVMGNGLLVTAAALWSKIKGKFDHRAGGVLMVLMLALPGCGLKWQSPDDKALAEAVTKAATSRLVAEAPEHIQYIVGVTGAFLSVSLSNPDMALAEAQEAALAAAGLTDVLAAEELDLFRLLMQAVNRTLAAHLAEGMPIESAVADILGWMTEVAARYDTP